MEGASNSTSHKYLLIVYMGIGWRPGEKLKYSSSVIHIFHLGTESPSGLELVKQVRLGTQQAQVIYLSYLPGAGVESSCHPFRNPLLALKRNV